MVPNTRRIPPMATSHGRRSDTPVRASVPPELADAGVAEALEEPEPLPVLPLAEVAAPDVVAVVDAVVAAAAVVVVVVLVPVPVVPVPELPDDPLAVVKVTVTLWPVIGRVSVTSVAS
jgi:hypothetical protein